MGNQFIKNIKKHKHDKGKVYGKMFIIPENETRPFITLQSVKYVGPSDISSLK